MSYKELEDEAIGLIAAFDDDGNLMKVINPRADEPRDVVTDVDQKTLLQPIPLDRFTNSDPISVTIHKIESFEILVYENLAAGARGRRRQSIHVRGNLIPHPG